MEFKCGSSGNLSGLSRQGICPHRGVITLTDANELRAHVLQQVEVGLLGEGDACELLEVSGRTLRRLRKRFREGGLRGLIHGNTGRRPANALPLEFHAEILALAKEPRYEGMNQIYFTEMLASQEKILTSASTVRRELQRAGISAPRPKRRMRCFRRRTRRPRTGMLLQMDASPHRWVKGLPKFSIYAAVDDATSDLWAHHRPTEDARGYFELFGMVAADVGLPEAVYTDQAGFLGGRKQAQIERMLSLTQFQRGMKELGVRHIRAKTAQAKGRVERNFDTLQDRLVSWFHYEGITSEDQVGASLQRYVVQHKRRFRIDPTDPIAAWRSAPADIDDALCFKHIRIVRNDNTVTFKAQKIDLPPGRNNSSRAKQRVQVIEAFNGDLKVLHDGVLIALVLHGPTAQPLRRPVSRPQRPTPSRQPAMELAGSRHTPRKPPVPAH